MLNVVCVRVGQKYGPEYVAILHNMVARNLSTIEHKFWCLTDDPDSLPEGVHPITHNPDLPGWWQKVYLFSADMPWAQGERVVYFDLDVAITGPLEDFAVTTGIIKDWHWDCYNSSVMAWDHGEHSECWSRFEPSVMADWGGDQEWITHCGVWPTFPPEWCVSYRTHAQEWSPAGSRVVCFHGDPKPHQITEGWVPRVWAIGGLTSLPKMSSANVSYDLILNNIRANCERDLPWFGGFNDPTKPHVIVCGGPSLKGRIQNIKTRKVQGQKIISVNNTLAFLMANKIKPDYHVMLDARPENAEFVKDAPEGVQYIIASQCDAAVFDALADRDVTLWHNTSWPIHEDIQAIVKPWWDSKPVVFVPGGNTVGLRCIWLCQLSGVKNIHIYGMDGCYHDTEHHAYAQPLNDGELTLLAEVMGKQYRCAQWMVRQAEDFQTTFQDMAARGVDVRVHGNGLIPDMCAHLRGETVCEPC